MPKVRVNNIELYYQVHGQGYPVIFQHGFAGLVDVWQPQVPALSQHYRFIIYDARGHGQSESPASPDQYSADIVVEDLFQLMGAIGIEKAVVGGLSMGGYESLRFYLRHPQMVAALIIMDTGPGYRNPARMEEWTRTREKVGLFLETRGVEAFDAAAGAPSYATREVMLRQNPIGLAHMSRKVVGQYDSWVIDNLAKINVPTLVLVGEDDTPFITASEYMARTIPGARYVVIPGAGHGANLDNAAAFNTAVLDFLSQMDLPGG